MHTHQGGPLTQYAMQHMHTYLLSGPVHPSCRCIGRSFDIVSVEVIHAACRHLAHPSGLQAHPTLGYTL